MATGSSASLLHGLPGEVFGILRRNPAAALIPALILGIVVDALEVLRHELAAQILLGFLLLLAFELYVGYAELLVAADRGESTGPRVTTMLRRATTVAPPLLVASIIAVSLPLAAAGLLVLPGLWLMTVWGVFAPAVVHEHLGPRAALARSRALVRGAFWGVAASVTLSVLVEHAVIHATAQTAEPTLGSPLLALVGAAVATAIVSPPAAFTISVVYERLLERAAPEPAPAEAAAAPAPRTAA